MEYAELFCATIGAFLKWVFTDNKLIRRWRRYLRR